MSDASGPDPSEEVLEERRDRMVREQLAGRDIRDPRVIDAMARVERHRFVPSSHLQNAYGDHPVPIGGEQTLSQPYIVALMTQWLSLDGHEKVLEIGTGSGYQTAVLAELAREVFTIEFVPELAERAKDVLARLGYENVRFRLGDGRRGWEDEAPFDAILVTAAPVALPRELRDQLAPGGRLVIPIGPTEQQELELHARNDDEASGFRVSRLGAVRFVPLV